MTSTSEVASNSSLPKQEAQMASLCNSSAEAKNGQLNILPSHNNASSENQSCSFVSAASSKADACCGLSLADCGLVCPGSVSVSRAAGGGSPGLS